VIPTIRKSGSEIWVSFNPELAGFPSFRSNFARARERQADFLAGQVVEIADTVSLPSHSDQCLPLRRDRQHEQVLLGGVHRV